MGLSDELLLKAAQAAGLGPAGVELLLGSYRIEAADESATGAGAGYELGLRLYDKEVQARVLGPHKLEVLGATLREYKAACPLVVQWLNLGAKRPLPEKIGPGQLLHAARTAGRLRAKLLRA